MPNLNFNALSYYPALLESAVLSNPLLAKSGFKLSPATISAINNLPSDAQQEKYQLLTQDSAYKNAFTGMDAFRKQNPTATEGDYLTLAGSYATSLMNHGLNFSGFYDNPQAVAKLIGSGIGAADFDSRVKQAATLSGNQDPKTVAALTKYYGISQEHIAAYLLDPGVATKAGVGLLSSDAVNNIITSSEIGGVGIASGLDLSKGYVNSLGQDAQQGGIYRLATIRQAEGSAALSKVGLQNIAGQKGHSLVDDTILQGTLDVGSASGIQLQQLKSSEAAKFSGSGAGTLSTGKDISGTY